MVRFVTLIEDVEKIEHGSLSIMSVIHRDNDRSFRFSRRRVR